MAKRYVDQKFVLQVSAPTPAPPPNPPAPCLDRVVNLNIPD